MTREVTPPPTDYTRFIEVLAALELPPAQVQVYESAHPWFDASRPLLVLPPQFEAARAAIADRYPAVHSARALLDGRVVEDDVATLSVAARAWLVAPLPLQEDARSLAGVRAVMERLYGPDGCPWDREQTHDSLRKYLLEECYEVVDAIDRGDLAGLREELGDLLAHVFMHTAMAQEAGEFSLEDVTESAVRKMVRRHPHVFGDEAAGSNEELLARWEEIKAAERADAGETTVPSALASVPLAAPALQRVQSLQQRAVRAGADELPRDPMEALALSARFLQEERGGQDLAELLWQVVRVARSLDVDAEELLRERGRAFTAEFMGLEEIAQQRGVEIGALPLEVRRAPWLI